MSDRKILLRSSAEELTIHPQEVMPVTHVVHATHVIPAKVDSVTITVWDSGIEYSTHMTLEPGVTFNFCIGSYRLLLQRAPR